MAGRKREGALTAEEKPIVKALVAKDWRNQDIQALVNVGREATVNSARIHSQKLDPAAVRNLVLDELPAFVAGDDVGINRRDAEEVLNLNPKTFSAAKKRGELPEARNGRFARAEVLTLAATTISGAEILARWCDGKAMPAELASIGGKSARSGTNSWPRVTLEEVMAGRPEIIPTLEGHAGTASPRRRGQADAR